MGWYQRRVHGPPRSTPGTVNITLAIDNHQYNINSPGSFKYLSPAEPCLDLGFSRLSRLVPRFPGDAGRLPREVVLKRAADQLESSLKRNEEVKLEKEAPVNKKVRIEELL